MSNLVNQIGNNIADEKTKARAKSAGKAFLGLTAIGLTIVIYAAGVYGISTFVPSGALKVFTVLGSIIPGIAGLITFALLMNDDI